MIKVLIGDMFETKMQTLVNTVNCVGVMGKGVAKLFKQRYPILFDDYKARCEANEVKLGEPYFYSDLLGASVLNFPTKDHWRSSSKIEDIKLGLNYFVEHYKEWGITSIAFAPLGCGNGGLDWALVGPLMYAKLSKLDIDVEIYAPFGTENKFLETTFLEGNSCVDVIEKKQKVQKFNSEWLVIIEVLQQLEKQTYTQPVGRNTFQKICYVITELGIDTGFKFELQKKGLVSHHVKEAFHYLANSNLITEKKTDEHCYFLTGKCYDDYFIKYRSVLDQYETPIAKTVDLFSRIKSAEQAQEVATVLYASRKVKEHNKNATEQELLDYIFNWNSGWEEKVESISSTIQNLEMLNWLKLTSNKPSKSNQRKIQLPVDLAAG